MDLNTLWMLEITVEVADALVQNAGYQVESYEMNAEGLHVYTLFDGRSLVVTSPLAFTIYC